MGQTLFVLTVLASWTGVGCDSPTGSNQKVPAELRLDPTDWAAVVVGSSVELTATFLDDDGEVIDPPPDGWPITWLSSDEAVASVADGVVTGVALGQTVITAAFGDLADEVAVYVEPVPTAEGLLLAIGVHPDTVAPGDPFRVTYTITNTTLVPVILTAASSCLAWVRVYFGGEPIGVEGLHHGCRAEITYWRIEGWRDWRYSALAWVEFGSATRWADSLPLDPGDYTIVFESQVLEINGEPAELPTISATLTVSP